MDVEWRPVIGARRYMVSDQGEVRSHVYDQPMILISGLRHGGYRSVGLSPDIGGRRSLFVHRLVIEAFGIESPSPEHRYVHHKNNDPSDNRLVNLEWVTHSENCRKRNCRLGTDHHAAKLNPRLVQDIRRRRDAGESWTDLIIRFRVSVTTLQRVVQRKTWKHVA